MISRETERRLSSWSDTLINVGLALAAFGLLAWFITSGSCLYNRTLCEAVAWPLLLLMPGSAGIIASMLIDFYVHRKRQ
jgi:hypothetical protein